MPFKVALSDDAQADFACLDARWRSAICDAVEAHLRHEPQRTSKSRIKRLQDSDHPQYRLRVDSMRVFYDIEGDHVQILGIVAKEQAAEWLKRFTDDTP